MAIIIRIDRALASRKMQANTLAEMLGISPVTMSRISNGKIKAVRIETLDALCKIFDCQPGDLFEYIPDDEVEKQFADGYLGRFS